MKTTLETSGEDVKTTLETSGEDVKNYTRNEWERYKNYTRNECKRCEKTPPLVGSNIIKSVFLRFHTHTSVVRGTAFRVRLTNLD